MNHYKEMQDKLNHVLGSEILSELRNPSMIELMCNEDGRIWVETFAGMKEAGFLNSARVKTIICTVAGMTDQIVDRENPDISAEMPLFLDGEYCMFRFQGMVYPTVLNPIFSIRRPASKIFTWDEYQERGVVTQSQTEYLKEAVNKHQNIIVAGGTASGKTTFVNTLLDEIARQFPQQRIGILQDTLELQCPSQNKFQLRASEYRNMDDLLKCSLRLRPDRIVVGEVRGKECLSLVKAWGTGHPGGAATVHANSASQALVRIEQLIQEANVSPVPEVIAQTINVVIYIAKTKANKAGRIVQDIIEVNGYDASLKQYQFNAFFEKETVFSLGRELIMYELTQLN